MALTQGQKVQAADVNSIKNTIASAYRITTGSTYTWTNSIAAGTLLKSALLTELNNIGSAANSSYATSKPGTHSNCSHNGVGSGNSNCSNRSVYTNNKCGGEMVQWLGRI